MCAPRRSDSSAPSTSPKKPVGSIRASAAEHRALAHRAAGLVEHAQELHRELVYRAAVARRRRHVDPGGEVAQPAERVGVGLVHERLGRDALHQPDDLEVLTDHLGVERRHERAAVGFHGDESVAGQLDHGLPHREPAHPQVVGDLGLGDAVAGAEGAGEDQAADVLGHELAGRLPRQRLDPRAGHASHELIMYQRCREGPRAGSEARRGFRT